MDFEDTPGEAAYRARARAFLEANAPPREGRNMVYRAGHADPGFIAEAKRWQRKKYDAGYAGITWPKEWGGQGGSAIEQVICDQGEARFGDIQSLINNAGYMIGKALHETSEEEWDAVLSGNA